VAIHLTDVPFGHIFQKPDDPSLAELAAWIVEKFRSWSDCDGNSESRRAVRRDGRAGITNRGYPHMVPAISGRELINSL
jgi:hypothetical protein